MSVSGSRAAVEINLDEFERRLRAAGAQPAGLEDPLFELARLVEASRPAAGRGAAAARFRRGAVRASRDDALRPAFDEGHDDPASREIEACAG